MTQYITRADLKKYLNAMAALDVIMTPKKQALLRLINVHSLGKAYAYVIDNGSGDNLVVIFAENGTLIKGFDHESEYNQFAADEWDNAFFEYTFSGLPGEFAELLDEDSRDNTTFCMWSMDDSDMWVQNEQEKSDEDDDDNEDDDDEYDDNDEDDDGGRDFLLGYIRKTPEEWCDWAKYYYETEIASDVVKKVYNGEPLTAEDVIRLNPERNAEEFFAELEELPLQ